MAEPKTTTKLNQAVEDLGRYFNVRSKSAFVNMLIDMEESPSVANASETADALNRLLEKPPEHKIGELFLQATEGGLFTYELLDILKEELAGEHASKIAELLNITFEPAAIAEKGCGAIARPIPIAQPDTSRTGHWGGAFFEPYDYLDKEIEWDSAVIDPTTVGPYTPSIRNLFWCQEMVDAMVEKDGDSALTKYDIIGRDDNAENADRDDAFMGLGINSAEFLDDPDNITPVVTCFDIKDPQLTPANRDSGVVAVFMNFVPSVEMSRCQPYLDIQIVSKRPPVFGAQEKIDSLSLAQFLMGNVDMKDKAGTADYIITKATNASILGSGMYRDDPDTEDVDEGERLATAGMEIFTSPQMMVNADDTDFAIPDNLHSDGSDTDAGGIASARAARVIDKFRPLASLNNFTVDVTPSGGMMSHKTAKLQITLHDRSRLAELGEFIKPDLYGSTELLIEYGWMHPDGLHLAGDNTDNPFATLLNSMRVVEKYKIVNSEFSFDEVGQVEIGVSLSMMGIMSFDTSDISKGPGVKDALKEVNDLFTVIRRVRRQMQPQGESGSSNATGETWLNSVSSMSGINGLDNETRNAMNAWRRSQRVNSADDSSSTGELRDALDSLLGDSAGEGGAMARLDATIDAALGWKKEHLKSSHSGDPWWKPIHPDNNNYCKVRISCCDQRSDPHLSGSDQRANGSMPSHFSRMPKFVSLGKLLMTYVAGPLAMDAKFDEIQWFFYPFNEDASFMRNRQISEFPINVEKFEAELEKLTEQSAYIPLRRFLGMLQRKFVGNIDNEAYGLTDLYTTDDEGNRQLREQYTDGNNPDALHDEKNKRLAYAYHGDETVTSSPLKFKKPRIGIHTECIPSMNASASGVGSKTRTILKIHVFDKACSSYSSCQDLLQASRSSSMGQMSDSVREQRVDSGTITTSMANQRRTQVIAAANTSGLLEAFSSDEAGNEPVMYRVVGGFPKIKNFIRSIMPSIIYGSANSAVLSANLASMNDPQMSTIMMMRSGHGDARSPTGTRAAGLPLKVVPASLDLELVGCPIVSFGQQFFVDFGTGTNVDNVYAIVGISHTLAQGEFKTKLKMTQLDAYGAYESAMNVVTQTLRNISEAEDTSS